MNRPTSNSETIKARTPLYILGAGTLTLIATVAIVAVASTDRINHELKKDLTQAAFSLAGTAIAGAAGLAQSNGKHEENQPSFENHGFHQQNNDGSSTQAIEPARKNENLSKN